RRRHGTVVHEGVPECDVPGLEGLEFAVEVLAAALEACLAIRHARERYELRCSADTRGARYECRDVLHVRRCRRALGEVLSEGVVEPVQRYVRGPSGAKCILGLSSFDQLPGCGDDVVGAARVRGRKVLAKKCTRAARPEQETDPKADR